MLPLIASEAELCDGFFHIKETPEAGIRAVFCLQSPMHCCSGKTTCLVARLVDAQGEDCFCRMYRNAAQSSCAEGFMIQDMDLLQAAAEASAAGRGPLSLSLYLTQQPCHYSSSNDSNSCTENLIRWRREQLVPRGVDRLRIAATYPYRTHWDERCMSEEDLARLGRRQWGPSQHGRGRRGSMRGGQEDRQASIHRARALLANAREGTRRLVSAEAAANGVTLDAFSEEDWTFILSLAEPNVAAAHANGHAPFTVDFKATRAQLDAFTRQVFDAHRGE